ncbi:MAG: hypothetical protein GVY27_09955 [Deinococcus-Thermus bacterium]|jgi:hypothetical protein|nr:hypothetical protein [Deinococcota bacterium]
MTDDRARPPKPRAAIRVGVTGHRPVADKTDICKLPPEAIPALTATVKDVLGRIAVEAEHVRARHAGVFGAPDRARCMTGTGVEGVVVSGLAAGADQVVAEGGLAHGYRLHAVIPFARDEYRKDHEATETTDAFDRLMDAADARFALDGARGRAPRAYEAAGLVMLANADILIAVWDRNRAEGRGGTAEIIERAIADGMPVVLIHPTQPGDVSVVWTGLRELPPATARVEDLETASLDALGEVVACLLAPPELGEGPPAAAGWAHRLKRVLKEIAPGRAKADHGGDGQHHAAQDPEIPLATYYAETERLRRGRLQRNYPALLAFFGVRSFSEGDRRAQPYVEGTRQSWASFDTACPGQAADVCGAVNDTLLPAFAFADNLAIRYANLYRGATIANYLLAFYAVFFALLGVWPFVGPWAKAVFVVVELVIIARILWNVVAGSLDRWHERFLEYRRLAEVLRPMRILAFVGAPDPIGRPGGKHAPSRSFVPWYARAIRRTLPLPDATVDEDYLAAVRAAAAGSGEAGEDGGSEIEGQIAYHETNVKRMQAIDHKLHSWGEFLFISTFYIGVAFLLVVIVLLVSGMPGLNEFKETWWGAGIKYFTTWSMALLPALGAAFAAIRFQCDFGPSARRSAGTLKTLQAIRQTMLQEADHGAGRGATPKASFALLFDRIMKAVDAMQTDLGEWHALSRTRTLTLPA